MIKKTRKVILLFIVGLACAISLCFGLHFTKIENQTTKAETYTLSDVALQNTYALGSEFYAPNATISYANKEYETVCSLTYPSGTVRMAEECILDEMGVYALAYKAVADDGTLLKKTLSFTVDNVAYSVSSINSKAYYGTHTQYAQDKTGIVVDLAQGDTFTYHKIIDLSGKQREEDLISFFTTPLTLGTSDAREIIVRFSDLYDADNYFEVSIHVASNVYATAAPLGERKAGLQADTSSKTDPTWTNIVYEGHEYNYFQEPTSWGTPLDFYMQKPYSENEEIGDRKVTVAYDDATKRVYARPVSSYSSDFVIDLDDDTFFSSKWQGFTTGETIVSIYGKQYAFSSLGLVITDICDYDLSEQKIEQTAKTLLKVDTSAYEKIPYGVVGKPYKLFDFTVKKPTTSYVKTTQKVYLNYRSFATEVSVNDGYFTPSVVGTYTIEYAAVDSHGGKTVETVDVQVKKESESMTMRLADGYETGELFAPVTVKTPIIDAVSGLCALDITAVSQLGTTYAVDEETMTFLPKEAGAYTVKYIGTDYISSVTISYRLTVTAIDEPAFLGDAVFPNYFIKNAKYSLPTLMAYAWMNNQTTEIATKTFIVNDCTCTGVCSCARTEITDSFTVTATKTLSVVYVATANGATAEKRYDFIVADVGYGQGQTLSIYQYFQVDENVQLEDGWFKGSSMPSNGDVTFEFIHELGVWNYDFVFSPDATQSYEAAEILLTDTQDESVQLKIRFEKITDTITALTVNDKYVVNMPLGFNVTESFMIAYMESTRKVTINANYTVEVLVNADGSPFTGFPSKKATMNFSLIRCQAAYAVKINRINTHVLSSGAADRIPPSVYYEGIVENKQYAIGEYITIPRLYVADVVDIQPVLSVKVVDYNGDIVTSKDEVKLDGTHDYNRSYEVLIEGYGTYSLIYEAVDYKGQSSRQKRVNFNVVDMVAPTVVLDKAKIEYASGDTVEIAEATVIDDLSQEDKCRLQVYVLAPDENITTLAYADGETEFTASQTGTYTVYYYAYDEMDNLRIVKYHVFVK